MRVGDAVESLAQAIMLLVQVRLLLLPTYRISTNLGVKCSNSADDEAFGAVLYMYERRGEGWSR